MSLPQLLRKLEKTRETYWNITRETGFFLQDLILTRQYKDALEIGTSNGYSALHLGQALKKTGGQLWTIESNYKKRFPLAQANIFASLGRRTREGLAACLCQQSTMCLYEKS